LSEAIFVHFLPSFTTEFDEQFVKKIKEVIKIIAFMLYKYTQIMNFDCLNFV